MEKQKRISFGYTRNEMNEIVIYKEQAEVVKLIFELYSFDQSLSNISKYLEMYRIWCISTAMTLLIVCLWLIMTAEMVFWLNLRVCHMLTENGILQNESRFEKAYTFNNENLTCLLFPFEGVQLDVGRLAMWRLETRETFGSTWLSDYVDNRLNGFVNEETFESVQTEDYEESEDFEIELSQWQKEENE